MKVTFGIVFSLLLLVAAPASAHHAFAAEFDATVCSDTTGILSRVDYQNPHAYIYVDVTNASGQVEEATFQLSSLSNLRKGRRHVRQDDWNHWQGSDRQGLRLQKR